MTRVLRLVAVVFAVVGAALGTAGSRVADNAQRDAAGDGVALVGGCDSEVLLQRGVDYTVVVESTGAAVPALGGCPAVPAGRRVEDSVAVTITDGDGQTVETVATALGQDSLGRRLVSRFVVLSDGAYTLRVVSADGITGHAVAVVYADGAATAALRRSLATTGGIVVASAGLMAWVWALRRDRGVGRSAVWAAPDPRDRRG